MPTSDGSSWARWANCWDSDADGRRTSGIGPLSEVPWGGEPQESSVSQLKGWVRTPGVGRTRPGSCRTLGGLSSYNAIDVLLAMALAQSASRVDVTLGTTELVMSLLHEAGDPVSRNWLRQRLKDSGHTTSRARLNRALTFCLELGLAVEGSKGVQWTHSTSPSLMRSLSHGRRI